MDYDFDVIVIGSGASGGTLAADLASSGARVLVLERGQPRPANEPFDERATLISKKPYDDRHIEMNQSPSRLYMGGTAGGGTSVYGAALLRPTPEDFHPGQFYHQRIPREIWDWPLTYDELQPFYERAERLYSVASDAQSNCGPLPASTHDPGNPLLPLARINQSLFEKTQQQNRQPFRLPLGIRTSQCLSCSHCAGFVCPTGARRSADQLLAESQQSGGDLTILHGREVRKFIRRGHSISGLSVRNRDNDALERFTARRYVVAAGAIATPAILQRSGFEHEQLGRNYMMHYSPLVAGLFLRRTNAARTFVKQLGFTDFYFGTKEVPEKMGIVQSLPAPGPLMLQKTGLKYVPRPILNLLRQHMLPFVGIVEDLPSADNQVNIGQDGTIRVRHQFSDYDRQRGDALTRAMTRLLKDAGATHCVAKNIPSAEHVAHQCGTVRFGDSAAHAVVDRDCRMFDQPDVFVVDGSILPTSLGVGPSLTLMANALRVSGILARDLAC